MDETEEISLSPGARQMLNCIGRNWRPRHGSTARGGICITSHSFEDVNDHVFKSIAETIDHNRRGEAPGGIEAVQVTDAHHHVHRYKARGQRTHAVVVTRCEGWLWSLGVAPP